MDLEKRKQKRAITKQQKKEQKVLAKERERHHKEVLRMARDSYKEEKNVDSDAYISLQHIAKIYPNHVQAVYDFNLDIKKHEFIVFVGPSGCGKSTTLRMIAGLEDITAGDLFIDGTYANELPPKDREIGMVFQSYALYPHMTVYGNMAFALRVKNMSREEIDDRIHKAADILEISEYLNRKPAALSGGQCQRVALGRAIVTDAKVFLMDEPLSNLDAKLRVTMRSELVKLHNTLNATTIYVTHDQTEAMTMADRIVVMSKGYVQQIGTPEEIFKTPKNIFVATFIGSPAMNLINVTTKGDDIYLPNGIKISMGKGFKDKVDEFYRTQISSYSSQIKDWKDEYLSRFAEKKLYKSIFKNETVNKTKLFNLISSLDKSTLEIINITDEEVHSLLDINDIDSLEVKLDSILREYLFAKEKEFNPIIEDLLGKLNKLEEQIKKEEKEIILGIRPEHIVESKDKESFKCKITLTELLGSEYFVHLDFPTKELLANIDAVKNIKVGDVMSFSLRNDCIHTFDPITKNRI